MRSEYCWLYIQRYIVNEVNKKNKPEFDEEIKKCCNFRSNEKKSFKWRWSEGAAHQIKEPIALKRELISYFYIMHLEHILHIHNSTNSKKLSIIIKNPDNHRIILHSFAVCHSRRRSTGLASTTWYPRVRGALL